MPPRAKPLAEKLSIHSKPDGNCIVWTGPLDAYGYGQVSLGHKGHIKAHRAAWIIAYGAIPEGLAVCHKCDNRACINPEHLFIGTNADNLRDMTTKGRNIMTTHPEKAAHVWGESNGGSVLTKENVSEILTLLNNGIPQREIARRYNVNQSTICRIHTGKQWRRIAEVQP